MKFLFAFLKSVLISGQFYYKVGVIGLNFSLVSGFVSDNLTAFVAFVYNNISLF